MATQEEIDRLGGEYRAYQLAADEAAAALLHAQSQYGVGSPQTATLEERSRAATMRADSARAAYEAVLPPRQSTSWIPLVLGAAVLGLGYYFVTSLEETGYPALARR